MVTIRRKQLACVPYGKNLVEEILRCQLEGGSRKCAS
jgi:hypothetical protein